MRHAAVKYLTKKLHKLVIEEEEEENAPDSEDEDNGIESEKVNRLSSQYEHKDFNAVLSPDAVPDDPSINIQNLGRAQSLPHSNNVAKHDDTVVVEDDALTNPNSDIGEPKKLENEELVPEIEDDVDVDDVLIEYPNKSSLVINSLIAGLEDENTLVQRITLDFMHSHFKLNCELFTESEKCILVEAALRLLIRKDLSLTRRVYTWMFGPPDLENKYQITEKNQYDLIISKL